MKCMDYDNQISYYDHKYDNRGRDVDNQVLPVVYIVHMLNYILNYFKF